MSPRHTAIAALFAAATGSTVLTASPSLAQAWCRTTTQRAPALGGCSASGRVLAWQSLCAGFSVFVAGSLVVSMDEFRTEAATAAARWHMVGCDPEGATTPYFQVLPLPDTSQPTGHDREGVNANTVSFNDEWTADPSHQVGTIAITIVSFEPSTGEILGADIEMNELSDRNPDGFLFTVGVPDPSAADLPTILTHEFGHFQGLGHSTVTTAVMYPEAGLGEQRRNLRTDDAEGICSAYFPDDAPTDRTCNATPYGGFASNVYGGRVRGGCDASPRAGDRRRDAPWDIPVLFIGGVASLVAARRRRRASR